MTAAFKAKLHDESAKRGISEEALLLEKTDNVPLGKYASLSDVANAVDGLLGAFSDHMTGANIVCDGGFIRAY